jgi:hypothetical protein
MWTHTPAVFGWAVAIWGLLASYPALAGAAAAAAIIARPATAPAAMVLGLYVLHRIVLRQRDDPVAVRSSVVDAVRFCSAASAVALAGALYNVLLFGNLVGGAPFRTQYWVDELGTAGMFSGSITAGLAGLTVSPSRGIFVYSPIAVVAIIGAVKAWRMSMSPSLGTARSDAALFVRYVAIAALATLLTYSKFIVWWGGHGYGPRYLTDAMPFLGPLFALGLSPIFERTVRARAGRIAVATVLTYSIAIQAIGAVCWPSSWTLNDNPPYRYRLWDWRENEIELCLRDGPRIDPAARALFRKLGF